MFCVSERSCERAEFQVTLGPIREISRIAWSQLYRDEILSIWQIAFRVQDLEGVDG